MRLELRGITKRFGAFTANDAVDLTVDPGTVHCLLGENGAGKSTLMNILGCLDRPTRGSYQVAGRETGRMEPDELAAGYVLSCQSLPLTADVIVDFDAKGMA